MKFFTKIPCEKCDLKFKSQEELMQHLQITHYKDLPYDCKKCGENFSHMEDMRTHLQKHHSYKKDRIQIAFTFFTRPARFLVNTLNPQMHWISGSRDNSSNAVS